MQSNYWYIRLHDSSTGPFSLDQIRQEFKSKFLHSESELLKIGTSAEWRKATKWPELCDLYREPIDVKKSFSKESMIYRAKPKQKMIDWSEKEKKRFSKNRILRVAEKNLRALAEREQELDKIRKIREASESAEIPLRPKNIAIDPSVEFNPQNNELLTIFKTVTDYNNENIERDEDEEFVEATIADRNRLRKRLRTSLVLFLLGTAATFAAASVWLSPTNDPMEASKNFLDTPILNTSSLPKKQGQPQQSTLVTIKDGETVKTTIPTMTIPTIMATPTIAPLPNFKPPTRPKRK